MAWLAAAIISALRGKPVSPRKLLPDAFDKPIVMTKEDAKRELEEIRKKVGIE